MSRIGGTRGKRLGLQGPLPVPAQARAQNMATYPVAFFPQFDRQAPDTVVAFVVVEHDEYFHFPGRFAGPHRHRVPLGVVAAEHHTQHPAQLLDGVMNALRIHEKPRAHGVGEHEKMAMTSFKISSSCTRHLLAARRVRTSAGSAGSMGKGCGAVFCHT